MRRAWAPCKPSRTTLPPSRSATGPFLPISAETSSCTDPSAEPRHAARAGNPLKLGVAACGRPRGLKIGLAGRVDVVYGLVRTARPETGRLGHLRGPRLLP